MIIIISGNLPSVKSAFAMAIEKSASYPEPDIQEFIPLKKPGHISHLTVYSHDTGTALPQWVLNQDDVVFIHAKPFADVFCTIMKEIHS